MPVLTYQYEPYRSPYTATIADLMTRPGEARARAQEQIGAAQARAAAASGEAWGNAASGIGQAVSGFANRLGDPKVQIEQQALVEKQRQDKVRTRFAEIVKNTPLIDEEGMKLQDSNAIVNQLLREGIAAPADLKEISETIDGLNTRIRTKRLADMKIAEGYAKAVERAGNDPTLALSVLDIMSKNNVFTPEVLDRFRMAIVENPTPETVGRMTQFVGGERDIKAVAPDTELYDVGSRETIHTGPKRTVAPTIASLAQAAHPNDPEAALLAAQRSGTGAKFATHDRLYKAPGDAEARVHTLNYQADTGKWFYPDASGKQVEVSPSELYSATEGGAHQWATDPKTGQEVFATPQEIREKGYQQSATADMRNREDGRKLVGSTINGIEELSKSIITKIGPEQRKEAIARSTYAVFGKDPTFRAYQDARRAIAGNLALAQNGNRLSDADIGVWLSMVPDAYSDTTDSAKLKWDLIRLMTNHPRAEGGFGIFGPGGTMQTTQPPPPGAQPQPPGAPPPGAPTQAPPPAAPPRPTAAAPPPPPTAAPTYTVAQVQQMVDAANARAKATGSDRVVTYDEMKRHVETKYRARVQH